MKRAFTMIELIFVIIIISILSYVAISSFSDNTSQLEFNNFKKEINNYLYIAENQDNYQIVPKDNSKIEEQSVKYWFKKNLQFVIESKNGIIFSYFFNDLPSDTDSENFDTKLTNKNEIYNNYNTYYIGINKKDIDDDKYPDTDENIKKLFNLTEYNIKEIKIYKGNNLYKDITKDKDDKFNLIVFNNNIFLTEGDPGDAGDTILLNDKRKIITDNLKFVLIDKNNNEYILTLTPLLTIN